MTLLSFATFPHDGWGDVMTWKNSGTYVVFCTGEEYYFETCPNLRPDFHAILSHNECRNR